MRPTDAAAGAPGPSRHPAPAPGRIAAAIEELTGLPDAATESRLAERIDARAT